MFRHYSRDTVLKDAPGDVRFPAVFNRAGEFPLVHLFEIGGVVDQDVLAEEVAQFAVGRKVDVQPSRSSPLGQGMVRITLCSVRSYCSMVGGPISKRSASLVAVFTNRIMKRFSGSASSAGPLGQVSQAEKARAVRHALTARRR